MADNDKRGADRVPAALRLKLRYTDVESFIDKYAANVSKGGIFIASRAPKPVGSVLRFEFQLADGSPVVRGEGKVVWIKNFDPAQPQKPHGMGIKFTRLDSQSKAILDRMIAIKAQARAEASGMGSMPAEGSGLIPLPAQGTDPHIVIDGSGPRPIPAERSGPRSIPAEPSGPQPVPAEPSGPQPVPAEPSGPQPVAAEQSGPRPIAAEQSGPQPVASAPPLARLDPGTTVPIVLTLEPAIEELEALAGEIGFTDEAVVAAVARAREIAAGANGDLEALLLELGAAAPPPPAPPPEPRRRRPAAFSAAPLEPGVARAAAQAPSFDHEERTNVELGRWQGEASGAAAPQEDDEATALGSALPREDDEKTTLGSALPREDEERTVIGFVPHAEDDLTPLDVASPYEAEKPRPPDDPAGGPRRGRLGDVVKKIFGK